jgi:adenylosuccinate lyase
MSGQVSDSLPALEALSPVDGRYHAATAALRALLSEAALIRERIRIEAHWLLHLSAAVPQLPGAQLAAAVRERARQLAQAPEAPAAAAVKAIELRINHDVKAVEYYVRGQLTAAGAGAATLELVHFGCTSEDINNLAYARLLQAARDTLLQVLATRTDELTTLAHRYADSAMPARTHGQAASPTTLGKELANFAARFGRAQRRWATVGIPGRHRSSRTTGSGSIAMQSPRRMSCASTCAATSGATSRSVTCARRRWRVRSALRPCRTR